MTHISATAFCVWSVLSTAYGAFLVGHLWRFDRFRCLRWTDSPYSGAFKRIMTYTYLITIPLIMVYSFGFTYIKYHEGFLDIGGTIVVRPYTFWRPEFRHAIFPLTLIFSFAWSFEMMTHLEELCFWLFLLNAGPAQPDWFTSRFFRAWLAGSCVAFVLVPAVTIAYRGDPLACEARMFTTGSVGDLVLTLSFLPILYTFPAFLRKVKAEGVDAAVMTRLRKFFELNIIRVFFRFLFCVPLLVLGADGLTPHTHINENMFWTDFLVILAGLGCVFSSACTLLIFFPRSYEAEYHAGEASQAGGGRSEIGIGTDAYAFDQDADGDAASAFDARSLVHSATPLQKPASSFAESAAEDMMAEVTYGNKVPAVVLRAQHKEDFAPAYEEVDGVQVLEHGAGGASYGGGTGGGGGGGGGGLLKWAERKTGLSVSRSLRMFGGKSGAGAPPMHVELPARSRTVGGGGGYDRGRGRGRPASVHSAGSSAFVHSHSHSHGHDNDPPPVVAERDYAHARAEAAKSRYLLTGSPVPRLIPLEGAESDMGMDLTDAHVREYAAYAAYADARASVLPRRDHLVVVAGEDIDPLRATPSPAPASAYARSPPPFYSPPHTAGSAAGAGLGLLAQQQQQQQYVYTGRESRPGAALRGPRAQPVSPGAGNNLALPGTLPLPGADAGGLYAGSGTPSSAHAQHGHAFGLSTGSGVSAPTVLAASGVESHPGSAGASAVLGGMGQAANGSNGALTAANILRHNRVAALGGGGGGEGSTRGGGRGGRSSMLNPLVHTFTSPIDLVMGRRENPAYGIGQAV